MRNTRPFQFTLSICFLALTACAILAWLFVNFLFPIACWGSRRDLPAGEKGVLAAIEASGVRVVEDMSGNCGFDGHGRVRIVVRRYVEDGECHVHTVEIWTDENVGKITDLIAQLPKLQRVVAPLARDQEVARLRRNLPACEIASN